MLLRTKIYNHNYYPIYAYKLDHRVVKPSSEYINVAIDPNDNQSVSIASEWEEFSEIGITQTSFNNDSGETIKAFQEIEYFTSIDLIKDVDSFNDTLVYDSTIYTDSANYGTFFVTSKLTMDIDKRAVTVRLDNVSRIISGVSDNDSYMDIEFSMKSISDLSDIENYLKTFNLSNYEIEEYAPYSCGVYSVEIPPSPPEECGVINIFRRSDVVNTLLTEDLINYAEISNGCYKLLYDEDEDDVYVRFRIAGSELNTIRSKCATYFEETLNSEEPIMPWFVLPIGMSVILNLTPKNASPYKLNVKVYTNITIFIEVSDDIVVGGGSNNSYASIKQLVNTITADLFVGDVIVPSPNILNIYSHPDDWYTASAKLVAYPFKIYDSTKDEDDLVLTINNISFENNDSDVIDGNIQWSTSDTLPAKKITSASESALSSSAVTIYIDVTNISEDYENTLIIDYTANGTNYTSELPIKVEPSVQLESNLTIGDITFSNSSIIATNRKKADESYPKIDIGVSGIDNSDILTITVTNSGNDNATIEKVEIIPFSELESTDILADDNTALDDDTKTTIHNLARYHSVDLLTYNHTFRNEDEENLSAEDLNDSGKITDYISYSVQSITNNSKNNYNNIAPITIKLKINRIKSTTDQIVGKCGIIKITYNNGQVCYSNSRLNLVRFINTKASLSYEKINDINYVSPNTKNTIYTNLFKSYDNNYYPSYSKNSTIRITDVKLITDLGDEDSEITTDEFFFDKSQLPLTILDGVSSRTAFSFDVDLTKEKLYNFKLRLYTNLSYIPYIEIPYSIMSTTMDADEMIKLDSDNFYVRNNKYFLSLQKGVPKDRTIKVVNTTTTPVIINAISFELPASNVSIDNFESTVNNKITYPFTMTNKKPLSLSFTFSTNLIGRTTGFIILETNLGMVYLPIVVFVNTKAKDVMIMMENTSGVSFKSALNSVDKDFIKLINFGDDQSLTSVTKLGSNKGQFLVESNPILYPNSTNYMEVLFAPTSTGKKVGLLDIIVTDMLETYTLIDSDSQKSYKIQNTNIIAELAGNALSAHALPLFSKQVVDFGYIAVDKKNRTQRYDTFEIKNLGLTPFIITNITKSISDSPFTIPLTSKNLPIKVNSSLSVPIYINNKKLTDDQNIYADILKFEMQDLKSKKMFTYDIIVKIELTEENKEYFSFNSEYVQFGYCQIDNFKSDELTIKNYSTDKVSVKISSDGVSELQTVEDLELNLWPSQSFDIPVYFYPHGIGTFSSKLKIDFNDGNYIKYISLHGLGVDFNSPLVSVENKMATYYKTLVNQLGSPVYI